MTYTWEGHGGEGLGYAYGGVLLGSVTPPTAITVGLSYDPTQSVGIGTTSGYSTTYGALYGSLFNLTITGTGSPNWPNFPPSLAFSMTITAPPPGQGLDRIDFQSQEIPISLRVGGIEILAPNGTLSASDQLPATLDAFQNYALTNPGGSFYFDGPFYDSRDIIYFGTASGTLGAADPGPSTVPGPSAVPEPSTIILMTIGAAITFSYAALRHRSRNRIT